MRREWKPGDVGLVPFANTDEVGIFTHRGWVTRLNLSPLGYSDVRPLVVIDPEDIEAVERLRHTIWTGSTLDQWQAALREFANPTPPKPDEPTGLGAVVEDVNFTRWTRVEAGETETRNPWYPAHDPSIQPAEWDEIAAVRVLSEGVR